jgi:hypothetical protein
MDISNKIEFHPINKIHLDNYETEINNDDININININCDDIDVIRYQICA